MINLPPLSLGLGPTPHPTPATLSHCRWHRCSSTPFPLSCISPKSSNTASQYSPLRGFPPKRVDKHRRGWLAERTNGTGGYWCERNESRPGHEVGSRRASGPTSGAKGDLNCIQTFHYTCKHPPKARTQVRFGTQVSALPFGVLWFHLRDCWAIWADGRDKSWTGGVLADRSRSTLRGNSRSRS